MLQLLTVRLQPALLLLLWLLLTLLTAASTSASSGRQVQCPDKCSCTEANELACSRLAVSDWLALARLPEPVWTSLLIADSPDLAPSLNLGDLSRGWQSRLQSLGLRSSGLKRLNASSGLRLPRLSALDLSANAFHDLDGPLSQLAGRADGLRSLQLAGNRFVELAGHAALAAFPRLRLLDFSACPLLRRVAFGFSDSLMALWSLRDLRFNGCHQLAAWDWAPALRRLDNVGVKDTPGWNCTCQAAWLASAPSASGASCLQPAQLRGRAMATLNFSSAQLDCRAPSFANFSAKAGYAVGDAARLLCRVAARPPACVTWVTNRRSNVTFKPARRLSYLSPADTHANTFHSEHHWHWDSSYDARKSEEGIGSRVLVLRDASLYIDYVTRADAGSYWCVVDNGIGDSPRAMEVVFSLKYEVLREVKKYGIIVGASCAASLLGIGFIIGLIRLIVRKCSEEERRKQNSIKEMLEHLESYRGAKMDQLKEYKDWLRASDSGQQPCSSSSSGTRVSKVKEVCISNMIHMQDSYNRRIARIRDHCDCQMERLRESYNSQMGRIKDYKSSQVDRVRDQYNQQLLRIKDYAATQLDRLRHQYRAQQTYLIKVLESVSIDSCMSGGVDERELRELGIDLSPDAIDDSSGLPLRPPPAAFAIDEEDEDGVVVAVDFGASCGLGDEEDELEDELEDFVSAVAAASRDRLDDLSDEDQGGDDQQQQGRTTRVRVEVLLPPPAPSPQDDGPSGAPVPESSAGAECFDMGDCRV